MTKKNYEAFANELRHTPPKFYGVSQYETWVACVNAVARVLARDNPRFDISKFWSACGVGREQV